MNQGRQRIHGAPEGRGAGPKTALRPEPIRPEVSVLKIGFVVDGIAQKQAGCERRSPGFRPPEFPVHAAFSTAG
jgi:hypothetical protein